MKTTIRNCCAALLALAFTLARADTAPIAVERDGKSGGDALASWTGLIPSAAASGVVVVGSRHHAAVDAHGSNRVLSSWTGSVPSAGGNSTAVAGGREAASIYMSSGTQLLVSWTGSIRGG